MSLDAVVRVSRVNGRKGDAFHSPTEQRATIQAWADRVGETIDQWHEELDESGKTTDRAGLRSAVDRAVTGKTEGVVFARLDRFARDVASGLASLAELKRAGRRIVMVQEGIDSRDGFDANRNMQLNMLLVVAQWYLEVMTEQWEVRNRDVITKGISRAEPFGYRRDENRRLVPVPAEAQALRAIFQGRADGVSLTELADRLNNMGMKPRRGERFTHARIRNFITSDVYLGVLRAGDLVNPNAHEPIIDRALWDAANGQNRTAKRHESEPFLLSGLIRCPSCGARMAGQADRRTMADGSVKFYRRYRCRRSFSYGVCPDPFQCYAEPVEMAAQATFRELYLSHRDLSTVPIEGDELIAASVRLRDAEAELSNYVQVASALDAGLFAAGLAPRQAELDKARENFAAAERARTGVALPPDLGEEWDSLPTETRRGYLSDGLAAVSVIDGTPVVWAINDPDIPILPGLGGPSAIVPLCAPGRPRVAG